jgi:hypothetical protein
VQDPAYGPEPEFAVAVCKLDISFAANTGGYSMQPAPVVLTRSSSQVEIHITQNPDSGDFSVLAFSGKPDAAPLRSVGQGPFVSVEAALAVRDAIARALQKDGYITDAQATAVWRFYANHEQRDIAREVSLHRPDCVFDPSQVLVDEDDA